MLVSSKGGVSLLYVFPPKSCTHIIHISCTQMSIQFCLTCHHNDIWRTVRIIQLLITQFPPSSCYYQLVRKNQTSFSSYLLCIIQLLITQFPPFSCYYQLVRKNQTSFSPYLLCITLYITGNESTIV